MWLYHIEQHVGWEVPNFFMIIRTDDSGCVRLFQVTTKFSKNVIIEDIYTCGNAEFGTLTYQQNS